MEDLKPNTRIDTIDTLIELGMLHNGQSILDLGCGGGNWAVDFIERGLDINYIGLDCQRPCEITFHKKISNPKYKFILLDARNLLYNPLGTKQASDIIFPVPTGWADLVICHSLFTHLGRFANAVHYINEIKKALKPGGMLWITFFSSPPNEPNYKTTRTVYKQSEIEFLLSCFDIFYKDGGESVDYNDQLMIGARHDRNAR